MSANHCFRGFILMSAIGLFACRESKETAARTVSFTKVDSLTESYLSLHDSLLQAWNMMVNDENQKMKVMHSLAHELMSSNSIKNEDLITLEKRLDELTTIRYTQKSIADTNTIKQYDIASNSLIAELTHLTESNHTTDSACKELLQKIKSMNQHIETCRNSYDNFASSYNQFVEKNKAYLQEIDHHCTLDKKPLFHITSSK